jgi:hypothetical protein
VWLNPVDLKFALSSTDASSNQTATVVLAQFFQVLKIDLLDGCDGCHQGIVVPANVSHVFDINYARHNERSDPNYRHPTPGFKILEGKPSSKLK